MFIYIHHAALDSIIFGCVIKPAELYIEAKVVDEKENPAEIPARVLRMTVGGFSFTCGLLDIDESARVKLLSFCFMVCHFRECR